MLEGAKRRGRDGMGREMAWGRRWCGAGDGARVGDGAGWEAACARAVLRWWGRDAWGGRRRRDGAGREAAWAMAQARAVLRRGGKTVRGGRQQGDGTGKAISRWQGQDGMGQGQVGARRRGRRWGGRWWGQGESK